MIRLTWRQFRAQAAVALGALVVIAIVLGVTGPHLVHLYDTDVATCHANCSSAINAFLGLDHVLQVGLSPFALIAPVLVGIFWGAPLVARELETGSFRLAWTQSVTRTHWLAVKLAVIGLASAAVGGLVSLMVTRWSSPFDALNMNRFTPANFSDRGLVPIGYAVFAFALGVTAGLLIRRTLPAMAATLIGFVAVRVAVTFWVRPHLAAPLRLVAPLFIPLGPGSFGIVGPGSPNDWILSDQTIADGQVVNVGIGTNGNLGFNVSSDGKLAFAGVGSCPNTAHLPSSGRGTSYAAQLQKAMQECANQLHIHKLLTYQLASRYWPFQWYEMGIFIGLALLLAGFCIWWVRHRLA